MTSKRRFRITPIILAVAVIAAGGAFYIVYLGSSARRDTAARIDELLAEADYEISLGYYDKAIDGLNTALQRTRSEYNYLRILKRVYRISYDRNDYILLNRFSRSAAENIPGSKDLAEIYLYSSIRSEGGERAVKLLKRGRENLAHLQAEAFFYDLLDTLPDAEQDPELKTTLSLLAYRNPTERDPYELQRIGTALADSRIQLDAALLWMEQGDAESAFNLISRHAGDPLFREPSIYISYDAGYEQDALTHLQQRDREVQSDPRPDLRIMEADLNLILGDAVQARRLYQEVIASHPQFAWTPYLNLASMAEQNDDRQSALGYREQAYRFFPDIGPVVGSHARSLMQRSNREQAAEILRIYLERHEDDYQAQLLLLDVLNTAASPAMYQAALWKLYNRHPESRMLCEHLFLYLLEFNDLSAAESVLRHYQQATGKTQEPWLLDYRAILSALRREYAEATRLLQDRLTRQDSWQARFNLAVLLGESGRPRQAIEQLIEAENLLPEQSTRYFQSRIRSRIGEQYLLLGDVASARRECEYAIDLDVSNFQAHRILRILERQ